MEIYEAVLRALNDGKVRYVAVGGMAVVLHGHLRMTADLDLMIDLATDEVLNAVGVLTELGLRPRAPVDPKELADPEKRKSWVADKNMVVFSFYDPVSPLRVVDIFVEHPVDFDDLWARSKNIRLGEIGVRIASIEDLILLKELSGRTQDRADIEALRAISEENDER